MARMLGENTASDVTLPENCPKFLDLETGLPDDERMQLGHRHDYFDAAWMIWQLQDQWTRAEHQAFWARNIAHWPKRAGQPHTAVRRAYALRAARRQGLELDAAAAAIGYSVATLRRRGVLAAERGIEERGSIVISDYMLPRVFGEGDLVPNAGAYLNLDQGTLDAIAKEDPLHQELRSSLDSR